MNTVENVKENERAKKETRRKKQENCDHMSVSRSFDGWECSDCRAEFQPVDKKLRRLAKTWKRKLEVKVL